MYSIGFFRMNTSKNIYILNLDRWLAASRNFCTICRSEYDFRFSKSGRYRSDNTELHMIIFFLHTIRWALRNMIDWILSLERISNIGIIHNIKQKAQSSHISPILQNPMNYLKMTHFCLSTNFSVILNSLSSFLPRSLSQWPIQKRQKRLKIWQST